MTQPAADWQQHPQVPTAQPAPVFAMPTAVPMAEQLAAMPQPAPAAADSPAPAQPFVMPADPAAMLDVAMPIAAMQQPLHAAVAPPLDAAVDPAAEPDLNAAWWSPAHALVLAVAALTWQFLAYYASTQLPVLESSGAQLTKFDEIIGNVPVIGTGAGPLVGVLLAVGALAMLLVGARNGVRARGLQIAVGAVAALSVLMVVALPTLAG